MKRPAKFMPIEILKSSITSSVTLRKKYEDVGESLSKRHPTNRLAYIIRRIIKFNF